MRYFEWNPLQLSSEIDNGARVSKQSVSFEVFRTYRRKVSWSVMPYRNFGIFYGGLSRQKTDIISAIAKQSNKFNKSVNISLFTFAQETNREWEFLENKHLSFFHHPFENSFKFFLKELKGLRDEIEEKTHKARLVEPSQKMVQIVLLDLGHEELKSLRDDKESLAMLVDLLEDSYFQRIHIGLFAESALEIPKDILDVLDMSAFLGTANDNYCRELYKDAEENEHSQIQVLIGTAWIRSLNTLLNLHPLKFSPNDEYVKAQQRFDEEDEAYERFLNSLDDGIDEIEVVE